MRTTENTRVYYNQVLMGALWLLTESLFIKMISHDRQLLGE
jgi:hypothetical protein